MAESEGDSKEILDWLLDQAKAAFGRNSVRAAYDFYTFHVQRAQPSQKRYQRFSSASHLMPVRHNRLICLHNLCRLCSLSVSGNGNKSCNAVHAATPLYCFVVWTAGGKHGTGAFTSDVSCVLLSDCVCRNGVHKQEAQALM